jgi:hypothetical protein
MEQNEVFSFDALNNYNSLVEESGLDLDLFTLIASVEGVLPHQGYAGYVCESPTTTNNPVEITVNQLVNALDNGEVYALVGDMLMKSYQDMCHNAAMKCHFNDMSLTPWEYADLETLTIAQHLEKAGIPLDKHVELKG